MLCAFAVHAVPKRERGTPRQCAGSFVRIMQSGTATVTTTLLADGTYVADVQAAIQAAWLVDKACAKEIAERYGLYDKICLRCASAPLAPVDPTKVTLAAIGDFAYQLCLNCHYAESRGQLLAILKPLP
jgi:hypothetical protein